MIEHKGEMLNVWVKDDVTEEGSYIVYVKSDCRFIITGPAGNFHYQSARKNQTVDIILAEKTLARLEEVESFATAKV